MAPSSSRLRGGCVRRVVEVKLRPDQYCTKMVDIPRLGRRGRRKVLRLGNKEMVKYSRSKEGDLDVMSLLSAGHVNEAETSGNSLRLILSDSDEEVYDEQENDILCNLVTLPSRRICLPKCRKRREKLKYGYSKFELRHDTLNLDRFFSPKLKFGRRSSRVVRLHEDKGDKESNSVDTFENEIERVKETITTDEAPEVNTSITTISTNAYDNKYVPLQSKDLNVVNEEMHDLDKNEIVEDDKNNPKDQAIFNVSKIADDIVEVVFSETERSKLDLTKQENSEQNLFEQFPCSSMRKYADGLAQLESVGDAVANNDAKLFIETDLSVSSSLIGSVMLPVNEAQQAEEPPNCSLETKPTLLTTFPTPSYNVSSICPTQTFADKGLDEKSQVSTGYCEKVANLQPPEIKIPRIQLTSPQDLVSELLLSPDVSQVESFLSSTKVPELDVEMILRLAPSPNVINNVVNVSVDPKIKEIAKHKFIREAADDDSDSDVVLLSDDETEISPPPISIIADWQSSILVRTWQEWPQPSKAVVIQLGLDTGLGDGDIKEWFRRRTEEELGNVWRELQNT